MTDEDVRNRVRSKQMICCWDSEKDQEAEEEEEELKCIKNDQLQMD